MDDNKKLELVASLVLPESDLKSREAMIELRNKVLNVYGINTDIYMILNSFESLKSRNPDWEICCGDAENGDMEINIFRKLHKD